MSMRQITLDIPEQLAAALTGLVIVTEKFLALRVPWWISSAILPWDWRILTALLIFANDKGYAWPSRKTWAAALGLPDGDWPRQFYDRLKRVPQQQQNGKTSDHIAPDPDGRCVWISNAACCYHLDSRGWRILTGLMYVCLSDALAMDPHHGGQGPLAEPF